MFGLTSALLFSRLGKEGRIMTQSFIKLLVEEMDPLVSGHEDVRMGGQVMIEPTGAAPFICNNEKIREFHANGNIMTW